MLSVDISNIWGNLSLSDLLGQEQAVFAAHGLLADAKGPGKELLGWRTLPRWTQDISALAQDVRECSQALVIVGSDGCAMAARAAMELLFGDVPRGGLQVFYAGADLSARHLRALLEYLDNVDFSINLISKTGADLPMHLTARSLRWLLERKYGSEKARQRILVTTDPTSGTLREMARSEGWRSMEIPADVPDSCAMLTSAALLPLAIAGVEPEAVLSGAREAMETMEIRSFENPAWLYAVSRHLLLRDGRRAELLVSGEPGFAAYALWWRQLMAAGGQLLPMTAVYPGALPGLGHMLQTGAAPVFETFVRFAPGEETMPVESDWKDLDGLGKLDGTPLPDLQAAVLQAALDAHVDAGAPALTVDCDAPSPALLGELSYFFELSGALSAYLLGSDPFTQTGLAQYRQNIAQVLSGL